MNMFILVPPGLKVKRRQWPLKSREGGRDLLENTAVSVKSPMISGRSAGGLNPRASDFLS
jgi:hypothetical protein